MELNGAMIEADITYTFPEAGSWACSEKPEFVEVKYKNPGPASYEDQKLPAR